MQKQYLERNTSASNAVREFTKISTHWRTRFSLVSSFTNLSIYSLNRKNDMVDKNFIFSFFVSMKLNVYCTYLISSKSW